MRNFADLHAAYGFVNEVESAERIDGSWKLDIDLGQKRRIYVYNQAGGGYDRIRKLDLQYQEGVGVGYKVIQQPKMVLSVEAGGQYQHLDYSPTVITADRNILSIRLGESLTWNIAGKINLTHRAAFMPNIEDFGDFRMRFELGLSYPLFKRMTINLNFLDDYDSAPPIGVDKNELQLQSTLGYTF
jgi:putative salt-induced outer membrane protein